MIKTLNMENTIKNLKIALDDKDYRRAWVSNIAMAQIDCERWYREENNKIGKHLNKKDRHAIANLGAEHFIQQLTK